MMLNNLSYRIKEFILLVILASTMGFFTCQDCHKSWDSFWRLELIMISIWVVMWYGNGGVSHLIDKYYSWLNKPIERFILGIAGAAVYSTVAILGMSYLFYQIFEVSIGSGWDVIWITIGVSISILLAALTHKFLFAWRELSLREEKMRSELLVSRYEVLKNQINPHFIFNGLNALTELVYEDQDQAVKYIDQLAKVMRYVLQAGKVEVVSLKEEMEILHSYIFLQKIRYADSLQVDIVLKKEEEEKFIAPLVLQMLFENAIKHNELTKENPLKIRIYCEEDKLMMVNNIMAKEILANDSTGIGLKNIVARYESLSSTEVKIDKSGGVFSVSIPLINQLK